MFAKLRSECARYVAEPKCEHSDDIMNTAMTHTIFLNTSENGAQFTAQQLRHMTSITAFITTWVSLRRLAEECHPVLEHDSGTARYKYIANKFDTVDGFGQVDVWLRALGLRG